MAATAGDRASAPLVATVTLNPAVDLSFEVDELIPGDVTRAHSVRRDPAGKGINVSRAVQEFGGRTLACGLAGGRTGRLLLRFLRDEGVPVAFNRIAGETRENVIVRTEDGGSEVRLSAPGPSVLAEELARLRKRVCCLPERPGALVLSGSLPPGVPLAAYGDIADEARHSGIPVVVDADGEILAAALHARPFLVKPNREEASRALGRTLRTDGDLVEAAASLRDMGAEHVALTSGSGSVVFAAPQGIVTATPPDTEAVSPVEAGDAFLGVLVLRLLKQAGPQEALRWAVAAGAVTAATPGTAVGHADEAAAILLDVPVVAG